MLEKLVDDVTLAPPLKVKAITEAKPLQLMVTKAETAN